MFKQIGTIGILLGVCSGCAVITPDAIRVESEHVSHITQHFGPDRTEYGITNVGVVARWNTSAHTYVELGEGYTVNGWMPGPKECTVLRGGYEWRINK